MDDKYFYSKYYSIFDLFRFNLKDIVSISISFKLDKILNEINVFYYINTILGKKYLSNSKNLIIIKLEDDYYLLSVKNYDGSYDVYKLDQETELINFLKKIKHEICNL